MTRKKTISILLILVMIVLFTLIIAFTYSCHNQDTAQSTNSMMLDPDAAAYEPSANLVTNGGQGIAIPGYSNIYFPEGETEVQLTLYNPDKNTCLFQFELYIDDEPEPIASTGLIEPGNAVQSVTLNRALEPGDYTLSIQVLPYTADTQTALNNALVHARLYVLAEE